MAAADDIPLSTASGRDSAYIAAHVHRGDAIRGLVRARSRRSRARSAGGRTGASCTRGPPPTCGPATRGSTSSSRCGTGSTRNAGSATPIWSGCWDEGARPGDARAARRRRRACSTTSPTMADRLPGAASAPARQGAQDAPRSPDSRPRSGTRVHLRHHPRGGGHGRRGPRRGPAAGQRGARRPPPRRGRDERRARHGRGRLSDETVDAAAAGGVREVLIDVNVGLPRCGCAPERRRPARRRRARARAHGAWRHGLRGPRHDAARGPAERAAPHRGVHGEARWPRTPTSAARWSRPAAPARTTSTRWVTEIQAGSYVLMDTAYAAAGLPFRAGADGARHGDLGDRPRRRAGPSPTSGSRRSAWTTATRPSPGGQRVVLLRRAPHVRARRGRCASATGCGCCPRTSTRPSRCTSGCTSCDGDEVLDTWAVDLRGW